MQRVIDSMSGTPAFVLNGRLDILAANDLGRALFAPIYADPVRPPNNARFIFLDPHATEFFRDWDKVANDTVALLRAEAGRDPYDRGLSDLIGELSTRSDEFRVRWAAHNVRIHTTGVKLLHHPVVGDLELPFESFPLAADPSQSLLTYTAEPGSPSQDALSLLASWAATTDAGQQREHARQRPARTAGKTGSTTPGHDLRSGTRHSAQQSEPAPDQTPKTPPPGTGHAQEHEATDGPTSALSASSMPTWSSRPGR